MRVMFKELFASPQQPTLLMNYIAMCKSTFKAKPPFRPCLQAPIKRSTRHYIYALTLPQPHPVIKQCNNIQPAKHHSQCNSLQYDCHPSFNYPYICLDFQQASLTSLLSMCLLPIHFNNMHNRTVPLTLLVVCTLIAQAHVAANFHALATGHVDVAKCKYFNSCLHIYGVVYKVQKLHKPRFKIAVAKTSYKTT